jgi:hypothetical protein
MPKAQLQNSRFGLVFCDVSMRNWRSPTKADEKGKKLDEQRGLLPH